MFQQRFFSNQSQCEMNPKEVHERRRLGLGLGKIKLIHCKRNESLLATFSFPLQLSLYGDEPHSLLPRWARWSQWLNFNFFYGTSSDCYASHIDYRQRYSTVLYEHRAKKGIMDDWCWGASCTQEHIQYYICVSDRLPAEIFDKWSYWWIRCHGLTSEIVLSQTW